MISVIHPWSFSVLFARIFPEIDRCWLGLTFTRFHGRFFARRLTGRLVLVVALLAFAPAADIREDFLDQVLLEIVIADADSELKETGQQAVVGQAGRERRHNFGHLLQILPFAVVLVENAVEQDLKTQRKLYIKSII